MANYILGGVMNAEAFIRDEKDNLQHYFSAKTLTDSTVNISVTSEEIRGGNGAQLLGRFFHTSNFGVNLTDALFDMKYLAAQVGSELKNEGVDYIKQAELTFAAGNNGTLVTDKPSDIVSLFDASGICANASGNTIAWLKGCDNSDITATLDGDKLVVSADDVTNHALKAGKYCVNYPTSKAGRNILVKAMYYPKEFSLILTGTLFAGQACSVSKSTKVGKIVIKIPRFQLDGTVDLGLNMSSAATIALNGFALAAGCDCNEDPIYAEISEILDDDQYSEYNSITVLDKDALKVGDTLYIYAFKNGKTPKRYFGAYTATVPGESAETKVNAVDTNGVILAAAATKAITVTITGDGALKDQTTTTGTVAVADGE